MCDVEYYIISPRRPHRALDRGIHVPGPTIRTPHKFGDGLALIPLVTTWTQWTKTWPIGPAGFLMTGSHTSCLNDLVPLARFRMDLLLKSPKRSHIPFIPFVLNWREMLELKLYNLQNHARLNTLCATFFLAIIFTSIMRYRMEVKLSSTLQKKV